MPTCPDCAVAVGNPDYDGVAHAHASVANPCAHCGADADHYCCSDPDACDAQPEPELDSITAT